ncbi:response regulator [Methylobacterium sp. J-068]|uniref:response regulator n=1 Tax=Methylobacterium sp. J-068 TaxID=2836649 RepID=UPI001FBBA00C|nr:response regulator [Methylobacterium sp. J-068]MCJ2032798.1 response regulator [Methylobacterium sp. J-068]
MSIEQSQTVTNGAAMGTRILLVEDDPGTQDLIRALCEGRGDRIDTAVDGFHGLRLLSEGRHEIVLIDYHLPEMDGYALARLMRELARPEECVRLIGITADRHGLASRRGADTLFDAILVKPLDPQVLFATLDRLMQPEPVDEVGDPAGALWRLRGLTGRPRAILCPPPSATEAEAIAQAFTLVESSDEADIVLISDETGLDGLRGLRGLRADGSAGLLPVFDLTGRFGEACDGAFQVGDPDSWTALARTSLTFGERRAMLAPAFRNATDAKARLAALMFVADRRLRLTTGAEPAGSAYETGYAKASLMAAMLQLMEAGSLTCEPIAGGVVAALTQAGHDEVTREHPVEPGQTGQAAPVSAPTNLHDRSAASASDAEAAMPVDVERLQGLNALIGWRQMEVLLARLGETLDTVFAPGDDTQTIARQAHTLISMAGSLGFDQLSQACQALQATIAAGADETRCLQDARRATASTKTLCRQGGLLLTEPLKALKG